MVKRIGILNAIDPARSQVNWGDSSIAVYTRFLRRGGMQAEIIPYDAALGQLPQDSSECEAYLITGSPSGVYDPDPWISNLSAFVLAARASEKKLVGICFGHQLLAHTLGGRAEKAAQGWGLGQKSLALLDHAPWMGARPPSINLYFAHQDQVVALPPGAQNLANNDFVAVGMFQMDGQVLGIQGHPEFDRSIISQIIANKESSVPDEVRTTAERSLTNGVPDNDLVGRWIVDFLGT